MKKRNWKRTLMFALVLITFATTIAACTGARHGTCQAQKTNNLR